MVESQSRYSIVERLTQRKLDVMADKAEIQDNLKEKEQKIDELKKDLKNWETDIEEDIKRDKRKKERQVENAQRDFDNYKEKIMDTEGTYDAQIKAIEEALKSIEEISKTSPTVQPK